MLEIRWHARAGQGAVTGAHGLANVVAGTGKQVQAFAFYGSAKRGASMTAYNRIDDQVILNHEKFMRPDYVLVIDPSLTFTDDICANAKENTHYIITTHLNKDQLIEKKPDLAGKNLYVLDCIKISLDIIGVSVPNAPMLGALLKVSNLMDLDYFLDAFTKVLGKKLSQKNH